MGGVGDALVAVELSLGPDVVVEDPELAPGALTELQTSVEAGHILRDTELERGRLVRTAGLWRNISAAGLGLEVRVFVEDVHRVGRGQGRGVGEGAGGGEAAPGREREVEDEGEVEEDRDLDQELQHGEG